MWIVAQGPKKSPKGQKHTETDRNRQKRSETNRNGQKQTETESCSESPSRFGDGALGGLVIERV